MALAAEHADSGHATLLRQHLSASAVLLTAHGSAGLETDAYAPLIDSCNALLSSTKVGALHRRVSNTSDHAHRQVRAAHCCWHWCQPAPCHASPHTTPPGLPPSHPSCSNPIASAPLLQRSAPFSFGALPHPLPTSPPHMLLCLATRIQYTIYNQQAPRTKSTPLSISQGGPCSRSPRCTQGPLRSRRKTPLTHTQQPAAPQWQRASAPRPACP